jgi:hypothetical protein
MGFRERERESSIAGALMEGSCLREGDREIERGVEVLQKSASRERSKVQREMSPH